MMPNMTDDPLDLAAQEFHRALQDESAAREELAAAQARRRLAAERVAAARVPLAREIANAAKAGRRQVDITKVTGYNRERVRQICRAAGVEPGE